MGVNRGKEVEYRCGNDCEFSGCPGHKLIFISHRSSDVLSVEIDGKPGHYFDCSEWQAMMESYQSLAGERSRKERK